MPQKPLTDEEICRKYGILVDIGDPDIFATAKAIEHSGRPDRVICECPVMVCPWCSETFTATYYDVCNDEPSKPHELACPECDRMIYVEHVGIVEPDNDDSDVFVTLCTHSPGE